MKNNRGMSLPEILVATVLLSIALLGLMRVLNKQSSLHKTGKNTMHVLGMTSQIKFLLNNRQSCLKTFPSGYNANALIIRDFNDGVRYQEGDIKRGLRVSDISLFRQYPDANLGIVKVSFLKDQVKEGDKSEFVQFVTFQPIFDGSTIIGCKDDLSATLESANLQLCAFLEGSGSLVRPSADKTYARCVLDSGAILSLPMKIGKKSGNWVNRYVKKTDYTEETSTPSTDPAVIASTYISMKEHLCKEMGSLYDSSTGKCLKYDQKLPSGFALPAYRVDSTGTQIPYDKYCDDVDGQKMFMTGWDIHGNVTCAANFGDQAHFRDPSMKDAAGNFYAEPIGFYRPCPRPETICQGVEILMPSSELFADWSSANASCNGAIGIKTNNTGSECVPAATCAKPETVCSGFPVHDTSGTPDADNCGLGTKSC